MSFCIICHYGDTCDFMGCYRLVEKSAFNYDRHHGVLTRSRMNCRGVVEIGSGPRTVTRR